MVLNERILVRVPNWIGDAVIALPALKSLKELYPKSAVTVLARPRVVPVFESNPAIDGICVYDAGGMHRGVRGRMRLASELRAGVFARAVLFQNAFDAALIAFMARIPERIGYARDLRSMLLTRPLEATDAVRKLHQVHYYLNIVKALGGKAPKRPMPEIRLSSAEESWAEEFLGGQGAGGAIIGAAPGASYGPAKMWPSEKYAAALETLSKELKATVILFGGPEDRIAAGAVSKALSSSHLNLAGSVGLREFMAIARRLKVFITNDSGPMHIGAALGVPTVAVFGSTDQELTGPLGPAVRVGSDRG